MQKGRSMNKTDINNEIDYSIMLTKEDIEALKEAEREIARGEGVELKRGMSLLELIKDRSGIYR